VADDRPKLGICKFQSGAVTAYTNAIVILYVLAAGLGAIIYPVYRISVREMLEALNQNWAIGLFEAKEHFVAIGLGMLPAYWHFWQNSADGAQIAARNGLTALIAVIVWYGFLVGHILNNIKGFGL